MQYTGKVGGYCKNARVSRVVGFPAWQSVGLFLKNLSWGDINITLMQKLCSCALKVGFFSVWFLVCCISKFGGITMGMRKCNWRIENWANWVRERLCLHTYWCAAENSYLSCLLNGEFMLQDGPTLNFWSSQCVWFWGAFLIWWADLHANRSSTLPWRFCKHYQNLSNTLPDGAGCRVGEGWDDVQSGSSVQ